AEFGTPILLVTHDLDECFELGEEMLVFNEGRVVQSGTPTDVLEHPAHIEVARLLGRFAVLEAEILELDPGARRSLLKVAGLRIPSAYLPGQLRGDRISILVRPERVKAVPSEAPGAAELLRSVERPGSVRLEFDGGLFVEISKREF